MIAARQQAVLSLNKELILLYHQIGCAILQAQGSNGWGAKVVELLSLAHEKLKNPYIFDFLSISESAQEHEVEHALCRHMENFLLEMGAGFAFIGRQYHLEVGGQDFYLDLLFYHVKLRCFVVVELKNKELKPAYAGKMNFYLSAVDDLLKHTDDQPSIGLILCKTKNNVLAEYTLRDMAKPIGIAEYRLTASLPEKLQTALPSIEELEAELTKGPDDSTAC